MQKKNTLALFFVVATIVACSTSKDTVNASEQHVNPPTQENPSTKTVAPVAKDATKQLSDVVLNLQKKHDGLRILLKTNTKINERLDAINAYKAQAKSVASTFDVSTKAAQAYMSAIDQSPSKLEEIRRNQKPRTPVHDDLDILHSLNVLSGCGPECSEWVLEFVEDSFLQTITTLLSSPEQELLRARSFCDGLELEDAEGEFYFTGDVKLFSPQIDNLIALQQGAEEAIQSLALKQENRCWLAWLSLCVDDDCGDVTKTLQSLSKAFPHMAKTLGTYQKRTRKTRLPHEDLKRLVHRDMPPSMEK